MQRQQLIKNWLKDVVGFKSFSLKQASADASFRRYFRVQLQDKSYIVMDAPPEKESLEPFATLSKSFRLAGVNTPEIFAKNKEQGFMLLSDFGSTSYLDVLNESNVDQLYELAIASIIKLQKIKKNKLDIPPYDKKLLMTEMNLFKDWYLTKFTKVKLTKPQKKTLKKLFRLLAKTVLKQEKTTVHRDYHSRNLMYLDKNNPGVIDFQDAVYGPITYDLVSLIKDCYIDWPDEKLKSWLKFFHSRLKAEKLTKLGLDQLEYYFDFMGVQRHLKAAGIFARLYVRDGKPGYINDIPRTLGYVQQMTDKYKELEPLKDFCVFAKDRVIV